MPPRRHVALLVAVLAPVLVGGSILAGPATAADDPAAPSPGAATLQLASAAAGASAWRIDRPVRVVATGGALSEVRLTAHGTGREVRGELRSARWTSTGRLAPRTTYVLEATAVATDGRQATMRERFRTGRPGQVLSATISPNGRTVGVGRPVVVTFSQPVRRRAAVESALRVRTSRDIGPASWSWTSSRTVQFRPRAFWPARTRVTVTADLRTVHAGSGVWGMKDVDAGFRVGRSLVMRVSDAKHRMRVIRDGKRIRTFGISMGKPGFTTRSGTKVIMDTHTTYRMRSSTVGITGSEAYDLDVPYAMRMTHSGEFLHGAPWNPDVGRANRSHGCTNLTLSDARWVFRRVKEGDPVVTRGTGRSTESWNGLGGGWNTGWKRWVAGSALR